MKQSKVIKEILKRKSQLNLDIEGKLNPQKGFITMDSRGGDGVDLEWNHLETPWPFPDETFDIIRADQVAQKVPRDGGYFIAWMNEVWRVLKYDKQFMLAVPYPGSYMFYQDPMNVNPCNESTFAYFDPLEPLAGKWLYPVYKPKPWRITHTTYTSNGIMEVLLEKRREDTSYGKTD